MKIKIGGGKKKQWGSSWDKRTNWGVCSWNQGLSKRPRRKLEVVRFRIAMLLDTDQGVREDAWCEQSIRQSSRSHQHWLWPTYRQQRYWHFPDMSPSPWWTHVCAFKWQQEKCWGIFPYPAHQALSIEHYFRITFHWPLWSLGHINCV